MSRERIVAHFREQAHFCDIMGSPFTARLIEHACADFEARGPVASLIDDWPGSPRADALALRLTGALHAAVLGGRDSALADAYPPAAWNAEAVWIAARAYLRRDADWVRAFLQSPPQTNETRRSIALLAGFLTVANEYDGPLETLELGASAGLNLNWDRFAFRTQSWSWNEAGAVPIDTDWRGSAPPVHANVNVRARAACDQNPLDIRDPDERLRLRSYIWPDQPARLARFDAAVALALASDVRVDRADAGAWIAQRLAARAQDAATIVYHSVFYQYPPPATREAVKQAIEEAGEGATPAAPLHWLRMEPEALFGGARDSMRFLADLVSWPGGRRRILAETDGHVSFVDALA